MTILLIVGLIKQTWFKKHKSALIKMTMYFPPYVGSGKNIKLELDLTNLLNKTRYKRYYAC